MGALNEGAFLKRFQLRNFPASLCHSHTHFAVNYLKKKPAPGTFFPGHIESLDLNAIIYYWDGKAVTMLFR